MRYYTERLNTTFLPMEEDLQREFEVRIAESSTIAFRVAFGVVRNRADAEDIAQDAFARAYQRFSSLRDRDKFRGWLVRTTWRLAIDYLRSHKRRVSREVAHAESASPQTSTNGVVEQERSEQLWQAIDALPEKLRIALVLANIEELNTQEVAALLDLPEGTVKSRLFNARQRLKELLQ